MRVLIVDDEPLAVDVLETYVNQIGHLELVASCHSAIEANEILEQEDIDLIFLDIQMPQLSGIDFLKALDNPPMVIFTTAYPNFAVEGFELNAVDYLLKPIPMDRFLKAVNKARAKNSAKGGDHTALDSDDFFFVKADKKLMKIAYDDILYIEGLKDYVIIRLEKGRVITLQTMKNLEKKLPANQFKRIHRSYIVNLNKIVSVEGSSIEVKGQKEGKLLAIGKNYKDELLALINRNKL